MLAGCSSVPRATVDALGTMPGTPGTTFALVPEPTELPSDPVFLRAAELTREHLQMLGFVEAMDPATPEIVITIAWHVGPPRQVVRTERELPSRLPSENGSTTRSESFDALPRGAMARGGSTPSPMVTYVSYLHAKSLTLVGRSAGEGRAQELWRVCATVTDSDPQLERHLGSLVGAAIDSVAAEMAVVQAYAAR